MGGGQLAVFSRGLPYEVATAPSRNHYSLLNQDARLHASAFRGINGPIFNRSSCGGANANGQIFAVPESNRLPPIIRGATKPLAFCTVTEMMTVERRSCPYSLRKPQSQQPLPAVKS